MNNTEMKTTTYLLSEIEMETLRRAARGRNLSFDPAQRRYTSEELRSYGMVREAYTREELRALGYGPVEVTSFNARAAEARNTLRVETPFGSGIEKWQLPIDMFPLRVHQTIFPPDSFVAPHMHPENEPDAPGGSLRVVVKGRIFYKGKEFTPGDWFFIPNGIPYEFRTDPLTETVVFYKYAFFGVEEGNRFSHPHSTELRQSSELEGRKLKHAENPKPALA